jgi:predicted RNA polymerase sigma factor
MDEAALAYRRAVELVGNAAERRYLEGRLREARAALS